MLATGFITYVVFGTIYFIVHQTVYKNLDDDLSFEAIKHRTEIDITGQEISFYNKKEWEENEHKNVEVNPVFLQIVDIDGRLKDKSPNMKEKQMAFSQQSDKENRFNTMLNGRAIRQVQIPLYKKAKYVDILLQPCHLKEPFLFLKICEIRSLYCSPLSFWFSF